MSLSTESTWPTFFPCTSSCKPTYYTNAAYNYREVVHFDEAGTAFARMIVTEDLLPRSGDLCYPALHVWAHGFVHPDGGPTVRLITYTGDIERIVQ